MGDRILINGLAMSNLSPFFVDAHVHLHECFELERFLAAAVRNFARAGAAEEQPGLLLMTESAGVDRFRGLREGAGPPEPWALRPTEESISLLALRAGRPTLLLIAGRQVVSREGLEVLALACGAAPAEGRPLEETLGEIRAVGGLPVLPWGFGKWRGWRGRTVAELIERYPREEIFLGDNGGRPAGAPRPRLFALARRQGVRILPGSDPLPLPAEAERAGSYGFRLAARLDFERPARDLRRLLRGPDLRIEPYGSGAALLPFLRNQLAMQLRKRRGVAA